MTPKFRSLNNPYLWSYCRDRCMQTQLKISYEAKVTLITVATLILLPEWGWKIHLRDDLIKWLLWGNTSFFFWLWTWPQFLIKWISLEGGWMCVSNRMAGSPKFGHFTKARFCDSLGSNTLLSLLLFRIERFHTMGNPWDHFESDRHKQSKAEMYWGYRCLWCQLRPSPNIWLVLAFMMTRKTLGLRKACDQWAVYESLLQAFKNNFWTS